MLALTERQPASYPTLTGCTVDCIWAHVLPTISNVSIDPTNSLGREGEMKSRGRGGGG